VEEKMLHFSKEGISAALGAGGMSGAALLGFLDFLEDENVPSPNSPV
jgi:hypothetical protein